MSSRILGLGSDRVRYPDGPVRSVILLLGSLSRRLKRPRKDWLRRFNGQIVSMVSGKLSSAVSENSIHGNISGRVKNLISEAGSLASLPLESKDSVENQSKGSFSIIPCVSPWSISFPNLESGSEPFWTTSQIPSQSPAKNLQHEFRSPE